MHQPRNKLAEQTSRSQWSTVYCKIDLSLYILRHTRPTQTHVLRLVNLEATHTPVQPSFNPPTSSLMVELFSCGRGGTCVFREPLGIGFYCAAGLKHVFSI